MHRCVVGSIALVSTLAWTNALNAQADTSRTQPATETGRPLSCWHPQPAPHCRGYLVTEVKVDRPFRSPDGRLGGRYGWALGGMINRGPDDAVGLVASYAEGAVRRTPFRVEGRYRRWLSGSTGLDLSLGYAQHNAGGILGPDVWLRGGTAAAAVEYGMFGIESRVDHVRGGGRTEISPSVGVRVGGYAAPVTALVAYIGLLAWYLAGDPGDAM